MEYNFDRKLRYKNEPQYKNLYSWAITEHDAEGQQIGRDEIPWLWSTYFTGTTCDLNDTLERGDSGSAEANKSHFLEKRSIRIKLRAGYRGYGQDEGPEPLFSMLGTKRTIKDITLEVRSLTDPNEQERYTAWGIASYTSERDFRELTTDDCLGFIVFVSQERFERFCQYIHERSLSIVNFSASRVSGFYSDWSPSISASHIKILVPENRKKVEGIDNPEGKLPVLGRVDEFVLWFGGRIDLERQQSEHSDHMNFQATKSEFDGEIPISKTTPSSIVIDLSPLRKILWLCTALLALIFFRLLAMN